MPIHSSEPGPIPVDLDAYPWSSHWDYLGRRKTPWLSTEFILRHFGGRQKEARSRYQAFLEEGKMRGVRKPWEEVKHQSVLGDEGFVERIKARLTGWREDPEIPSGMRLKPRPTPEHVHRAIADALPYVIKLPHGPRLQPERLVKIYLTKKWTGLSLKAIGAHFGLSYSTVSHLAKDVERRRASDPRWDRVINRVERCLPANPKI